jgi:hypothetical protein
VKIAPHLSRFLVALLLSAIPALAATYYIDSAHGNDNNSGTSQTTPWQSLAKISATDFKPGDHILLHSNSVWQEQLAPRTSGTANSPIVFDRYGDGARPRIDANGAIEDAVLIRNIQQIEIHNLEITNHATSPTAPPAVRRGVHILLDNFGTATHIVIDHLYIHDVSGTNEKKDNGGIIFSTNGPATPSRFDDLRIENNIVWKVDRSAIAGQSYHWSRNHWFPSLNVVIRGNYVDDIGGDGIVPWATDGALVEYNIARNCNRRAASFNAAIWQWSTDNTLLQWNEASETHDTRDGEGFDSDYNSRGTIFQYNYSHDNEGGFMLICSPGERNPAQNIGNTGTIVRRNISHNDHTRIFHISAVEHSLVEENAIYVGPGLDIQMVLASNWSGWTQEALFSKNRFYVEGIARFGHASASHPDGTYEIAPGWAPAKDIVFSGNQYFGTQINRPEDPAALLDPHVPLKTRDWTGPQFDPADPGNSDAFDDFMARHKAWLRELMKSEFGNIP